MRPMNFSRLLSLSSVTELGMRLIRDRQKDSSHTSRVDVDANGRTLRYVLACAASLAWLFFRSLAHANLVGLNGVKLCFASVLEGDRPLPLFISDDVSYGKLLTCELV